MKRMGVCSTCQQSDLKLTTISDTNRCSGKSEVLDAHKHQGGVICEGSYDLPTATYLWEEANV